VLFGQQTTAPPATAPPCGVRPGRPQGEVAVCYFGGKTALAATLAGLLPAHEHYVEPFAGSLAVLPADSRTRMETVNDLDGELMLFWRVLRDRPPPARVTTRSGPSARGPPRRRAPPTPSGSQPLPSPAREPRQTNLQLTLST